MRSPILGIKIDVDTYRGMREGVPALIRILAAHKIRASFFVSMGPDNSGKAVLRFFTKRGFLKKMLRSNAVGMYGIRTALSGTLLPARQIARSFPELFRELIAQGHEVGIHGFDHVRWHDRLSRMSYEETAKEIGKASRIYTELVGWDAECSAAPGWTCSPHQLAIQDATGMIYHSDSRGTRPFFPIMNGKRYRHLQIPTTLPTLDELLGSDTFHGADDLTRYYLDRIAVPSLHIITIHAEAEGMAWVKWFDALLGVLQGKGVQFMRIREIAEDSLADPDRVSHCELLMGNLPGRAGLVAIQQIQEPTRRVEY
ncbi:MAG: polysaccharide deacetylase family protein [Candidatus Aureabacteria bacterium]|nr:polysaccharide deacetylase family protein [Candidatus Auribacterota bacterium]